MDPNAPLTKEEIDALLAQDLLPPAVANGLMPGGGASSGGVPTAEIPPIVMNAAPPKVASDLIAPGVGGPKQTDTYAALGIGPAAPPTITPSGAPTPAGMMAALSAKPPMAPPPGPTPIAPVAQPAKPVVALKPTIATSGGPSPAASALSKVYTPAQIAGFGLKAEEIAQAGEHNAALAEEQANKAGQDATTVQEALDVANTKLAKMEAAEAERKQVKQAALASLNTKWDELAKTEIDPERYWNSKDTGEKILGTIGLILGGLAGGLQGTGRNVAMDVLQANISRDVEAQKANFMAKAQGLQGKQSVYRMMVDEFGDERMAEQATYATHWDMVSKQLQEIALTSQNNVTKENALYAKQYADNQVSQYVEGVQANAELSLKQMQAAAAAAAHAKMAARDEAIWKANLTAAQAKATELGGEVVPDAKTGMVYVQKGVLPNGAPNIVWEGTKSGGETSMASVVTKFNANGDPIYEKVPAAKGEAAKITAANEGYADAKSALADLKKIQKDTGYVFNTPGEVANKKAAIAKLKLSAMKTLTSSGRISPVMAEQIDAMIPTSEEIADYSTDVAVKKLEQVEKMLDTAHENMLKGGGAGGETLPLTDVEGGEPAGEE